MWHNCHNVHILGAMGGIVVFQIQDKFYYLKIGGLLVFKGSLLAIWVSLWESQKSCLEHSKYRKSTNDRVLRVIYLTG